MVSQIIWYTPEIYLTQFGHISCIDQCTVHPYHIVLNEAAIRVAGDLLICLKILLHPLDVLLTLPILEEESKGSPQASCTLQISLCPS